MPLTLQDADIYLSQGVEGPEWAGKDDAERYKALVSAERLLKFSYTGKSVPNEAVFLQAAWSISAASNYIRSSISSVSVSDSGISTSYSRAGAAQPKDLLSPYVVAMLGEPSGDSTVNVGPLVY